MIRKSVLWMIAIVLAPVMGLAEAMGFPFEAFTCEGGKATAEISMEGLKIIPEGNMRNWTLTFEVMIPEKVTPRTTLVSWRVGETRAIRFYKGDRQNVYRAAWCSLGPGENEEDHLIGGDLTMAPGVHTVTISYYPKGPSEVIGTRAWVDEGQVWYTSGLRFSENVQNRTPKPDTLYLRVGNDAKDEPSTLMKGLQILKVKLLFGKAEVPAGK
ncbi:MAG: hypothetical protein ACI4QJ_07595 [Candidatus Spyradenecus sp.]